MSSNVENQHSSPQHETADQAKLEQQRAQQQLTLTVSKAFPSFSTEQKVQLMSFFAKYQQLSQTTFQQTLDKLQSLAKNYGNDPQILLPLLDKLLKQQELDRWNQNNKKLLLTPPPPLTTNTIKNFLSKYKEQKNEEKDKAESYAQIHQELQAAYQKLDPQFKTHQPELLQQKLAQLPASTQQKLQKQGIDPREYASFLLSKEAIQHSKDTTPTTLDFIQSLKKLENTLGIRSPDALPLRGVDKDYIAQNPDIVQYIREKAEFTTLDQSLSFDQFKTAPENFDFVKRFGDGKLNALQDQISSFFDENGGLKPLSKEEQKLFQDYRNALVQLKHNLTTLSSNMLKAGAMQAPALALQTYLDQDSSGPASLADQLKLAQNSSTILTQNNESIMKISGTIEGHPLNFYYNLTDPTESLTCDDYLNYDNTNHRVNIGHSAKTKLNITLPTSQKITQHLSEQLSPQLLQQVLKDSSSVEEYQSKLNTLITETMQELISPDPAIRSRLSMHTEKNLVMQQFSTDFTPPHLHKQLKESDSIAQNPQLRNLFQIIDHISEHSTSSQLITLRQGLQKLSTILQDPPKIEKISDPIARQTFAALASSLQEGSTYQQWTDTMFDFFSLFLSQDFKNIGFYPQTLSSTQIFNFTDFEHFLQIPDQSKDLISANKLSSFSDRFAKNYLHQTAHQENIQKLALDDEFDQVFNLAYA